MWYPDTHDIYYPLRVPKGLFEPMLDGLGMSILKFDE